MALHIIHGLPGSGKSYLIKQLPKHIIKLTQSRRTKNLNNCIKLVESLVYDNDIYLESWGWEYPTDKPYPIQHLYFERNISQCIKNIICDSVVYGITPGRMDALIRGMNTYFPPRNNYRVYPQHVYPCVINEYFLRFPDMIKYKDIIDANV